MRLLAVLWVGVTAWAQCVSRIRPDPGTRDSAADHSRYRVVLPAPKIGLDRGDRFAIVDFSPVKANAGYPTVANGQRFVRMFVKRIMQAPAGGK